MKMKNIYYEKGKIRPQQMAFRFCLIIHLRSTFSSIIILSELFLYTPGLVNCHYIIIPKELGINVCLADTGLLSHALLSTGERPPEIRGHKTTFVIPCDNTCKNIHKE